MQRRVDGGGGGADLANKVSSSIHISSVFGNLAQMLMLFTICSFSKIKMEQGVVATKTAPRPPCRHQEKMDCVYVAVTRTRGPTRSSSAQLGLLGSLSTAVYLFSKHRED